MQLNTFKTLNLPVLNTKKNFLLQYKRFSSHVPKLARYHMKFLLKTDNQILALTLTLQKPEGFRVKTRTETYKIRRVIPPSGGVKGEIVVGYLDPLTTQDLKFSGFPVG